jgi:hypothetical protein
MQKKHLTKEGLEQIIALRCNLNRGLTDVLKTAFPNVIAVPRPVYQFNGIPNPFWISGFVSGDFTFCVSIEKSPATPEARSRVRLIFGGHLHIRDKALLIGVANYFNILNPNIYDSELTNTTVLQIRKTAEIVDKIIPFFNQYPVLGVKRFDYFDFSSVAVKLVNKEHLTELGFVEIAKIAKGMNLDRPWS